MPFVPNPMDTPGYTGAPGYTDTNNANDSGVQDFTISAQDFGFPKRKFIGFSPGLSTKEQMALRQELGLGLPSPRQITADTGKYITTPVLYDSEGRVAGRQYDLQDPFIIQRELEKLTTDERIRISQELKRVGWYGGGKVSQAMLQGVGFAPEDENAWAKLFSVANNAQRVWSDVVGLLGSFASADTGGTAVRVTSDEDAAAYTREVFLQQLGRMPTRMEMAEAANFIRNRERQAVASGQQVPNTGLLAEAFAQKADPTSRVVYGLGNAISLAFQALGR